MNTQKPHRIARSWPVLLLCLPAFVAIWGGWVGLGELTGFGVINLLPGMVEDGGWATMNTAITLPIGLETYAAYALHVFINAPKRTALQRFAGISAVSALLLGGGGQVAYHVMESLGYQRAPIWVTAVVGSLPVLVLGMGTMLASLVKRAEAGQDDAPTVTLAQRVASARSALQDTIEAAKGAVSAPVGSDLGQVPAPALSEVPLGPERPARVPAPRRATGTPGLRGEWDVAKAVQMLLDGATNDAVADAVGIGAKAIQRTRRALTAIRQDSAAVIPAEWKVPAAVVQTIRDESRRWA